MYNKECYQVIFNEDSLKEFIEWLPELEDNHKFYGCLFARKKYAPELVDSSDRTQLRRFVTDKSRLLSKIRQMEVPMGSYTLKGRVVPQEALALYIHPNPRNMLNATRVLGKKCWDLFQNQNFNPHNEALSCVQKSRGKAHWVDFDIDIKEGFDDLAERISDIITEDCFRLLETRGGYHLLVAPDCAKQITNTFYNSIRTLLDDDCDQVGDNMMPVPGCVQGDFVPEFIH